MTNPPLRSTSVNYCAQAPCPEDVAPVGMAIRADGSRVIISLCRNNHIAVVDAHTKEIINQVPVGSRA